jgi:ATP-dependent Lon protease
MVMFPGIVVPITLGRDASIAAAQFALKAEQQIGIVAQKDASTAEPGPDDMHRIGTIVQVLRYVTTPDGNHLAICQGEERLRIVEFVGGYPFMAARVERIVDETALPREVEARMLQLKARATEALQLLPKTPPELIQALQGIQAPGALADMVASFMDIDVEQKQKILEILPIDDRLDRVLWLLAQRIEVLRLSRDINERVSASMDKRQREFVLREQMKTIQKELGEDEGGGAEIADLERAVDEAGMPEEVLKQAKKELKRLQRMPDASAEHSMVRTYLEWLTELPWAKESATGIDMVTTVSRKSSAAFWNIWRSRN